VARSLSLSALRHTYASGEATAEAVFADVLDRIESDGRDDVWIALRPREEVLARARTLSAADIQRLPLYGVPFSVKDNIDVAGLPTTAACPAFGYRPAASAKVVARLEAAGAICVGKTNLDQFATGLTGVRSPYGACGSAFDRDMVGGGSSSGSGASVGLQQVSFSIGTDTGGSGRVPAALNNVVGLKPTPGTLSAQGLVPCCPTLDCPSVFALSVEDAVEVAALMFEADLADPSLRDDVGRASFAIEDAGRPRILAPRGDQLEFFGNSAGAHLFETAIERLEVLGAVVARIDFACFREAGDMVFDGPWVADRYNSVGAFVDAHPEGVLPETREIIQKGRTWSASQTFAALARLRELKADVRTLLGSDGVVVTPTVAPQYSIADIRKDPISRNTHQGRYSYFANILDLCAFAVPADFYACGLPFGITLFAPAFRDAALAGLAARWLGERQIASGKARAA